VVLTVVCPTIYIFLLQYDVLFMANLLDLKNKINSTKNTGQITKALEMVSAARQRKAQDFLNNSRFLRAGIRELMANISGALQIDSDSEFQAARQTEFPRFFRTQKTVKILVISVMSQRGLCGALNSNLFFEILKLKRHTKQQIDFISVNKLAQKYLKNFKENVIAYFADFKENPDIDQVMPLISYVKEHFDEYEAIYIAYSDFVKSGIFKAKISKLLPIENVATTTADEKKEYLEFSIEPDPLTLLDSISGLYIDLEIYEAVLASQASEHSARMIAMKKATDNVKTMVSTLTLKLNKERQAKITQQMAEISANI
jgi:F-type H+-transporting ATPase subunit gamma